MAFLVANGSKRRLLSAALSCLSTLQASASREHQGALLLLCGQLQLCRCYSRPRGPLWRGKKGIGKEALHVLGEVKRNKADNVLLGNTFQSKVSRLLKTDLLAVLQELQRQNEVDLASKVFNTVRKEVWYKPDIYLYRDMLSCLAKAKRVDECERLLKDLKVEGLPPDGLLLTEVMTAYLENGMLPQAMETFEAMRQGSVPPDLPAFKVLLRYLKKMGQRELRAKIRREYLEFYEGVVESKHRKRREETDEEEAGTARHQSGMYEEDEEIVKMVMNQSARYDGSDEEKVEMASHQNAEYRKSREKGEMERCQSAGYEDSDEEEMEMESDQSTSYEESEEEEAEMERHGSRKHEESDQEEEF